MNTQGQGQTYPLSTLWERYTELSGHASAHVRTSALAGLAVSWLFAGGTAGDFNKLSAAPTGLLLAAAVFAASLGADILHYFVGAWRFRKLAKDWEGEGKVNSDLVKVPPKVPRVAYGFYNVKVWLLFAGYVVLVVAFVDALG